MKRSLFPVAQLALAVLAALVPGPAAAAADPPSPAPAATAPPRREGAADPAAATAKAAKGDKPMIATVLPGTRKVLGYEKVKPYASPDYETEPSPEPSEVKTIEVVDKEAEEVLLLLRPWVSPLVGVVPTGTRLGVRGVFHPKSAHACPGKLWYAIEPQGWLCSKNARATAEKPTDTPVLKVPEGERLPFTYVMLSIKEGDKSPMWESLDTLKAGAEPERHLERGDSVAVARQVKLDGAAYFVSVEGKVFPVKGTMQVGPGSAWHGVDLDEKTEFPFGWVTPEKARVFPEPQAKGKPAETIERRARVTILEEQGEGGRRMLRIGDGKWLRAADVNEVRKLARPEGITAARQWIDVDLGEQVLVAYDGDKPVFATLTSSGRAIKTPRGNYPVWARATTITMKSQPYEDKSYFVNKVPWSMFFQAHNAIHGAYWHDRFGVVKSHGCVNVSPLDARHLFEWVEPSLPVSWSGWRAPDLLASPTVHVRNSHEKKELVQERPIGPPDKELEQMKMDEAEERRAATGGPPVAGRVSDANATAGGGLPPAEPRGSAGPASGTGGRDRARPASAAPAANAPGAGMKP